jgi:alpha-methylacyl-CoA racemase
VCDDARDGKAVSKGPLRGLRVVEIASAAPAPFGCMMLADLGADVVRIDRTIDEPPAGGYPVDPLTRGRRTVRLDLKSHEGIAAVLELVRHADVLVEGFRPGVAERLGIGPDACASVNSRLIYARMTGFGQTGPLATRAGHDINYIALSGALEPVGTAGGPPIVPLNLVGDFGGGGMLLALGVLAAVIERQTSGLGQVIDAAMVDGSALLTSSMRGMMAAGNWSDQRGSNMLDGGAPFYGVYGTADGKHMSVGAIEGKFYRILLAGLGIDAEGLPNRFDKSSWPELRARIAEAFASRTRDEWCEVFEGLDACVTPVLSPAEAVGHPHAIERNGFYEVDGILQAAPAPRFSRSSLAAPARESREPEALAHVLGSWGSES